MVRGKLGSSRNRNVKFEVEYTKDSLGDGSIEAISGLIRKSLQTLLLLREFCDDFKSQPAKVVNR